MAQGVTATAAALANDIRATGHAAVYGILFDTGKADIKTESAQAIGEIAKLLKNDAALKLYVVGHTDNVGSVESNLKLSDQRAQAVLKALTGEHGIAAALDQLHEARGEGIVRPPRPQRDGIAEIDHIAVVARDKADHAGVFRVGEIGPVEHFARWQHQPH